MELYAVHAVCARCDYAGAHRSLRKVNDLLIQTLVEYAQKGDTAQSGSALVKLVATHNIRPRHLAILANAILTTAGTFLDSEWSVEVEAAWDEALHNLIAEVIRARVDARH